MSKEIENKTKEKLSIRCTYEWTKKKQLEVIKREWLQMKKDDERNKYE